MVANFVNPVAVDAFIRYHDEGNTVRFSFRPWNDLDSALTARVGGADLAGKVGQRLNPYRIETSKAILAVALWPYP